jgi:hypothetical protein
MKLVPPHGGKLNPLLLQGDARAEEKDCPGSGSAPGKHPT